MSAETRHAATAVLVPDAELIDRVRAGDNDAYAELWRRHRGAGMAAARSVTSKIDPDDLVSEAFAKILIAIRNGGGPTTAFRAYLLTAVRNLAASWGGSNKEVTLEDFEVEDPQFSEENALAAIDKTLTAAAFRALPQRWQEVLWYTEVERMAPAQAAPLLGVKAGAVPALAYRAREGLRQAWIQAHFENSPEDSECRWAISNLGANARKALAKRDRARMDAHLETCERCTVIASEADGLASRLALILLPLTIGGAGVAGYLSWAGGAAPAAAAGVAAGAGHGLGAAALDGVRQTVIRVTATGAAAATIVGGLAFTRVVTPRDDRPVERPAAVQTHTPVAPGAIVQPLADKSAAPKPSRTPKPRAHATPDAQLPSVGEVVGSPPPTVVQPPANGTDSGSVVPPAPEQTQQPIQTAPSTVAQPSLAPQQPETQPSEQPSSTPSPSSTPLISVGLPTDQDRTISLSVGTLGNLTKLLSTLVGVQLTLAVPGYGDYGVTVSSDKQTLGITLPVTIPTGTTATLHLSAKLLGIQTPDLVTIPVTLP